MSPCIYEPMCLPWVLVSMSPRVCHESLNLWARVSAMSPWIYEPAYLLWVLVSLSPSATSPCIYSISPRVCHESLYLWSHVSFMRVLYLWARVSSMIPCIYEPMCLPWVLVSMSSMSTESLYQWTHVSFMWVLESNLHWTGGCGRGLRGGRGGGGELPRVQSWRGDSSHQGETREIL